jgi:biotin carboxyl carrier protein
MEYRWQAGKTEPKSEFIINDILFKYVREDLKMKKFLIKVNGNQYEVEVEEVRDGASSASVAETVSAAAAAPSPVPAAPAAAPARKPASTGTVGAVKITAPMPGTILKVTAKPEIP